MEALIRKHGENLIRDVELFDLFHGGRIPKGFKNLGFRVVYQSSERTLLADEIQNLHTRIAQIVAGKFEASFQ